MKKSKVNPILNVKKHKEQEDRQFKEFIKNTHIDKKTKDMIQNGLGEAIGFQDWNYTGVPFGTQLSQVNTLFNNNRWYLVSNMRQLLSELYVEHGLIQSICSMPVRDAFRGGIEISSKQLDEDEIQKLQISIKRNNDLGVVAQAAIWNRLFGGAGVLIMTDQDPIEPLDISAITKDSNLEFRAVDLWELFWTDQNIEGYDPEIQTQNFEYYNYYAKTLHKSRVMRLVGERAPSFIRPRLRGWGFSVIEHLVRSINQYLKTNNLTFEVLDEFKIDVYKMKNLTDTLLSPNGEQQVSKRIRMANWAKNYQHALIMDSEDDYIQKQLSFAGISDVMREIRMQIASDMKMPFIKLFGQQAGGGLGNSGEDEIEVYNCMVEGEVREKVEFDILRVVEIRCQKLFGFIPDDLSITFKPLRTLNSVEEETVKTSKFNRLIQAKTAGEITRYEFRDACNKDKLLSIQLDNADDELNPDDPEIEMKIMQPSIPLLPDADAAIEDGNPDPRETTGPSIEDPGANKEDTRKPRAWDYTTTQKTPEKNKEKVKNINKPWWKIG